MRPKVKVTGAADIRRKLNKLRETTKHEVVQAALASGAEIVADEAKRLVPEKTGNLRASIGVGTQALNYSRSRLSRGHDEVFVGPRQGPSEEHDGFYGHMVEFGTARAAPHPFMRPAFDAKSKEALRAAIDHIADELDRNLKG